MTSISPGWVSLGFYGIGEGRKFTFKWLESRTEWRCDKLCLCRSVYPLSWPALWGGPVSRTSASVCGCVHLYVRPFLLTINVMSVKQRTRSSSKSSIEPRTCPSEQKQCDNDLTLVRFTPERQLSYACRISVRPLFWFVFAK